MIRKIVAYIRMRILYIRVIRNSRKASKELELVPCFLDTHKAVRGFVRMRDIVLTMRERAEGNNK